MTIKSLHTLLGEMMEKGFNPEAPTLTFCNETDEHENLVPHCLAEKSGPIYFGPESQQ